MTQTAKLAKIEQSLTPQQAVLHWTEPFLGARTGYEYIQLRCAASERGQTYTVFFDQVRAAATSVHRQAGREQAREGRRRAVREAAFLLDLFDHANEEACQRWQERTMTIHLLTTTALYLPLLWVHALGTDLRADDRPVLDWAVNETELTRRLIEMVGQEVLIYEQVMAVLSERYFGGRPILFAGAREQIEGVKRWVHEVADTHNLSDPSHPIQLDLDQETVRWLVQQKVDIARSGAWRFMGETNQALQVIVPYQQEIVSTMEATDTTPATP